MTEESNSNRQKHLNLSIVKLYPHPSISSKMSSNQKSDTSSSSSSSNTDKVYHHPKFGSCVKLHAGNYNQWQLQMLAEINVSSKQRLWAEAVATSVYLRNRLPTRLAEKCQIPYQLWHGKLPSIENLHPFGCLAYANKTKEQIALGKKDEIGTKYSSQTELCIMVGYTSSTKIWKLYSLERHHMSSHKIFTSADVKFDDNIFPMDGGKVPVDNDKSENDDLLKEIENNDPFKDIENPNDELDTENDDSDCSDEELEEYSHHHCLNTDLQKWCYRITYYQQFRRSRKLAKDWWE